MITDDKKILFILKNVFKEIHNLSTKDVSNESKIPEIEGVKQKNETNTDNEIVWTKMSVTGFGLMERSETECSVLNHLCQYRRSMNTRFANLNNPPKCRQILHNHHCSNTVVAKLAEELVKKAYKENDEAFENFKKELKSHTHNFDIETKDIHKNLDNFDKNVQAIKDEIDAQKTMFQSSVHLLGSYVSNKTQVEIWLDQCTFWLKNEIHKSFDSFYEYYVTDDYKHLHKSDKTWYQYSKSTYKSLLKRIIHGIIFVVTNPLCRSILFKIVDECYNEVCKNKQFQMMLTNPESVTLVEKNKQMFTTAFSVAPEYHMYNGETVKKTTDEENAKIKKELDDSSARNNISMKGWAALIYDISQNNSQSKKVTNSINNLVGIMKGMFGGIFGSILPEWLNKPLKEWFGIAITGVIQGTVSILVSQIGGYLVEYEKNFLRLALRGCNNRINLQSTYFIADNMNTYEEELFKLYKLKAYEIYLGINTFDKLEKNCVTNYRNTFKMKNIPQKKLKI